MKRAFTYLAIAALVALGPAMLKAGEQQDAVVAQRIAQIMRNSGKMQSYAVGVKYKDGTVWLNGRVSSREQLETALAVVSEIEGIDNIVNNLKVDGSMAKVRQPGGRAGGKSAAMGRSPIRLANATSDVGCDEGMPSGYSPLGVDGVGDGAGYGGGYGGGASGMGGRPLPMYSGGLAPGAAPATFDEPHMPNYAWPSYAASPNYGAVTYPKQYSPTAWPFIGPFYPYPQVPLGWRKVSLEWDDGWWFLDFDDRGAQ